MRLNWLLVGMLIVIYIIELIWNNKILIKWYLEFFFLELFLGYWEYEDRKSFENKCWLLGCILDIVS